MTRCESHRHIALAAAGVLALIAHGAVAAEGAPAAAMPPHPPYVDEVGLVAGETTFASGRETGGPVLKQVKAYRAYPAGKSGEGVVLVMPSNGGVNDNIRDIVRRFAKAGYYAIAADYPGRYETVGKEPGRRAFIFQQVEAYTQADVDGAIAFAGSEKADTSKVAMMGFSGGARQIWKYMAFNKKIKAGSPMYGPLSAPGYTENIAETHPSPIEIAHLIDGRIKGFYPGQDPRIPEGGELGAMRAALKAAGDTKTQIVVYPNAKHGFFEYGAAYDDAAAKDAWAKMLAWFKAQGVN